jgi:acyl-CoA thioester hydrolase
VFGKVRRGSDGKKLVAHRRYPARPTMGQYVSHHLRVRYRECDQQGVVFNGHYFSWFDDVFTEAFRELGMPYDEVIDSGVDVVVAEAKARYRAGARFDDELELRWWVTHLGNTAMVTRIDVRRGDQVLVEGEIRYVFVNAHTTDKRPIPDEFRAKLEPYLSDG